MHVPTFLLLYIRTYVHIYRIVCIYSNLKEQGWPCQENALLLCWIRSLGRRRVISPDGDFDTIEIDSECVSCTFELNGILWDRFNASAKWDLAGDTWCGVDSVVQPSLRVLASCSWEEHCSSWHDIPPNTDVGDSWLRDDIFCSDCTRRNDTWNPTILFTGCAPTPSPWFPRCVLRSVGFDSSTSSRPCAMISCWHVSTASSPVILVQHRDFNEDT